jgi:predicted transglutaminase-like protease
LSTLKVLPELIKTSILKETHPDKGKDVNIKEIQRLYGTVNYGEKKYPIKITVKIIKSEGNKAYSYEVMGIESPDEQLSQPGNSPTGDI